VAARARIRKQLDVKVTILAEQPGIRLLKALTYLTVNSNRTNGNTQI